MAERQTLGIGILGAGFIGNFHVTSWQGVRDGDIVAVCDRNLDRAQALALRAVESGVGEAKAYDDLTAMLHDPAVDAVWVLINNASRLQVIETIVREVEAGRSKVRAIAVEKPLSRTVAEAKQILELVEGAGLLHGYLENQLFAPGLVRSHDLVWKRGASAAGSPYLARCAEEHSGPHAAWFWDGERQGGGVLNDMMCHSVEAGRFLLTPPGMDPADWLTPVSVQAKIASLKWGRPSYADRLSAEYGQEIDYRKRPSEDYAHATFELINGDGEPVVIEATTSWSFVGAGLRLNFELLGPEYSMASNTLNTESTVFLSRELQQSEGEDLVEKQNAEQGLMPLVSDEAATYGYTGENQAMTADFLAGLQPRESLRNGVTVVEMLMAAYKAAETGETVRWPVDLDAFVPAVARGEWNPRG